MPTSSAMMTTMFGFLATVCAEAIPPNARGTASIAVARRLRLIIDVSFQSPNLPVNERASWSTPQEMGQRASRCTSEKKYPIDQRRNETHRKRQFIRHSRILRKFGEPPKIRRHSP